MHSRTFWSNIAPSPITPPPPLFFIPRPSLIARPTKTTPLCIRGREDIFTPTGWGERRSGDEFPFFPISSPTFNTHTYITMFEPRQLKLHGHTYNERYKVLPDEARKNANHFRRLIKSFEPDSWMDRLTQKQETLYHYVFNQDSWLAARDKLAKDVATIPVISVSIVPGVDRPEFLGLSTFTYLLESHE